VSGKGVKAERSAGQPRTQGAERGEIRRRHNEGGTQSDLCEAIENVERGAIRGKQEASSVERGAIRERGKRQVSTVE